MHVVAVPSGMAAINDVDAALEDMMKLAGKKTPAQSNSKSNEASKPERKKRGFWRVVFRWTVTPVFLLLLPFVALLKGSTLLYQHTAVPVWICVAGGALGSGILFLFATWRLGKRLNLSVGKHASRFSLVLAGCFTAFTLLYVSADNVKTPEVASTYTALHPLLRLATSTLVLVDSEGVITDGERVAEDYIQMGLETNSQSLHFEQSDGYVHALDLRTIGRSELRNRLTNAYYSLLGFQTLRHTGTADHLHISLPGR